jgi:hypothetical protein
MRHFLLKTGMCVHEALFDAFGIGEGQVALDLLASLATRRDGSAWSLPGHARHTACIFSKTSY